MMFRISSEDAGKSLLQFLKERVPNAPSVKSIKRAIEARGCKVNGKLERFASYRLRKGDSVELMLEIRPAGKLETRILYEDDDVLAIDKPSGAVCTPQGIQKLLPNRRFSLVHRLDKETTGILLLAKNEETKTGLEKLFSERKIKKTYLALVHNWLHEKEKTFSSLLVKHGSYAGQTIYRSVQQGKGVRAITHFRLVKKSKAVALIECEPLTGRTHQLRVQLAALGSPILGDTQYGNRQDNLPRHMLHGWKVSFLHPRTQKPIAIIAPLPADFEETMNAKC